MCFVAELAPFVIRVCMNPLLFLFVFTYIMPHMTNGAAMNPTQHMAESTGVNFSTVLLPGLMAVGIMFSGIAAVALPLAVDFGSTREIDDRVMCPLPVASSRSRKLFSRRCSPLSLPPLCFRWRITSLPRRSMSRLRAGRFLLRWSCWRRWLQERWDLTIGTAVKPQQIGLIFSVIVIPITFLGCIYYPWTALHGIRWLQIGVLVNPIVYMGEGLRAALTPTVSHMPPWLILAMLMVALTVADVGGRSWVSAASDWLDSDYS